MPPAIPSEQRDVVVAHKHDTTLYVAAESGRCIARRDELVGRIPPARTTRQGQYGRHVVAVGPDDFTSIPTDESWCLAVLVCPGDRMDRLLAWARGGLEAAHYARIRFYVDAELDEIQAVEPWTSVVSPVADVVRPRNEKEFIRVALTQLNDQIYADFAPDKPPGVPWRTGGASTPRRES